MVNAPQEIIREITEADLESAIKSMPQPLRFITRVHFLSEVPLDEIPITRGYASNLRTQALRELRKRLEFRAFARDARELVQRTRGRLWVMREDCHE